MRAHHSGASLEYPNNKWNDSEETDITIRLEEAEEYDEGVTWYDVDQPSCHPFADLPVWINIETTSGELSERVLGRAAVSWATAGEVWADAYGNTLGGSVDLARFGNIRTVSDVRVFFQVVVDETSSGTIRMDPQNELDDSTEGAYIIAEW